MLTVNNKNNRTVSLTSFCVFSLNFEQFLHLVLVPQQLTLNRELFAGKNLIKINFSKQDLIFLLILQILKFVLRHVQQRREQNRRHIHSTIPQFKIASFIFKQNKDFFNKWHSIVNKGFSEKQQATPLTSKMGSFSTTANG